MPFGVLDLIRDLLEECRRFEAMALAQIEWGPCGLLTDEDRIALEADDDQ